MLADEVDPARRPDEPHRLRPTGGIRDGVGKGGCEALPGEGIRHRSVGSSSVHQRHSIVARKGIPGSTVRGAMFGKSGGAV